MDLNGFNANNVDPNTTFDPIPAGWYKAIITASEEKSTKAKDGSYLEMKVEVVEGGHKGRLIFERLHLNNKNQTAVDIAQKTLSAICHATGVMTPSNSSELHGKPVMVKVSITPAQGGYDAGNEIKGYEAVDKEQAPAASSGGGGGDNTPPWKK